MEALLLNEVKEQTCLLNRKKSISVAKTDHFLWCRHSLPNSKVLSPPPPKTITINQTELGYLRIRSGPATSFEEVGQVTPGQTFEIFEQSDPAAETGIIWYQIEYEDKKYGWVSGNYVSVE